MITQTIESSAARSMPVHFAEPGSLADWGVRAPRYALIVIFLWFGALKFTDYEASGVAPLILNSPLVMWLHGVFGIAGAAHFLGVYELATGLLIAARRWQPRLAVVGGAMAILTFLVTLSFLFTTPGVVQPGYSALHFRRCRGNSCSRSLFCSVSRSWSWSRPSPKREWRAERAD